MFLLQLTVHTGYFDLSIVYGATDEIANNTRTFVGGQMKEEKRHGQSFLQNADNSMETCGSPTADHVPCYGGGKIIHAYCSSLLFQFTYLRTRAAICCNLQTKNIKT